MTHSQIQLSASRDFELQIQDESAISMNRRVHYKIMLSSSSEKTESSSSNCPTIETDVKPGSLIKLCGLFDDERKNAHLTVNGLQIATHTDWSSISPEGPISIHVVSSSDDQSKPTSFKHKLLGPEIRTHCPSSPSASSNITLSNISHNLSSINESTKISIGDKIVFSALSNPGASYEWDVNIKNLSGDSDVLALVRSEFVPSSPSVIPRMGEDLAELPYLDFEKRQVSQPLTSPSTPFVTPSRVSSSSMNPPPLILNSSHSTSAMQGHQNFEWVVRSSGECLLSLSYLRSWNRGVIERSVKKKIVVSPAV
eukprot:GDKJ01005762.1.p1 GENE.GDKJ01005762.1~~GDKJ01005762.1.p1  ORF type:complete len:320 (+),score=74.78 GDKJ01005762.1:28-960(+)